MRLTDEQIMDIKEYLNRSIKITISSLIPRISKHGLDLIDTIEALQQENERLRAQVARMQGKVKYLWGLLDDIDTAGDMAKNNDKAYRSIVESIHPKRFDVAESDGYEIFIKDDTVDYHNPADVEALRKAREALITTIKGIDNKKIIPANADAAIELWRHKQQISDALVEIDKAIGGGQ